MNQFGEHVDEVEIVFQTCSRSDPRFNERIAEALANDIEREREQEPQMDYDEDPFAVDDDEDEDEDYLPNEDDTSDIESEQEFEVQLEYDSDDEENEVQSTVGMQPVVELQPANENQSEMQEVLTDLNTQYFVGKDGTKWNKSPPPTGRTRLHNIMRFTGGPVQNNSVPIEVFKKFFTPNIVFIIVNETNRYANSKIHQWNTNNPGKKQKVWKALTEVELNAFIGILVAAGVSHNNLQHASVLWKTMSLPIFRATMSYKRFVSLSRFLRFDDNRTREFRAKSDKAAPIRDIWNFLNENLEKNYRPHSDITIDEQLFPYRGRTKFTQYIPSKPARYGIKVWWACDAKTHYPLHGNIYTGKDLDAGRAVDQGETELMRLASKYANSGRTIVADNFFTTLQGCKRLMDIGLGYVGTLRSNKRCVPPEMKKHPSRPIHLTEFGFHENRVAIISYVPKKNKAVILLSTLHYDKNVVGELQKPEAILYYNKSKGGVDVMDQMLSHYSTKRRTKRWSLAFFYNMVDVMALASYIICKEIDHFKHTDARRKFLFSLSEALVRPQIELRCNNRQVIKHFVCRSAIEAFLGGPLLPTTQFVASASGADVMGKRRDCRLCHVYDKVRRKTRYYCEKCLDPVCQQHSKCFYNCFKCHNEQEATSNRNNE